MKRAKHLLSLTEHNLLRDLLHTAQEVAQKRKKQLSHLRFAKPTRNGWYFFKKKSVCSDLLEEITHKVGSKHPQYERGMIAHILSELVNLTKSDLLHLQAQLL